MTALKGPDLQTWIALGGFDFSDPNTATHTTWSDLCATPASRAAFISSVQTFMVTYGFQGVDLDWEYPGTPERGGTRADIVNFVSLVQEMRLAFGSSYGISLTLASRRGSPTWASWPTICTDSGMQTSRPWDKSSGARPMFVRFTTTLSPLATPAWISPKITYGVAWYG